MEDIEKADLLDLEEQVRHYREAQIQACEAEVQDVLRKYACTLVPVVEFADGTVRTSLHVRYRGSR